VSVRHDRLYLPCRNKFAQYSTYELIKPDQVSTLLTAGMWAVLSYHQDHRAAIPGAIFGPTSLENHLQTASCCCLAFAAISYNIYPFPISLWHPALLVDIDINVEIQRTDDIIVHKWAMDLGHPVLCSVLALVLL
jgi:hypothetical protein